MPDLLRGWFAVGGMPSAASFLPPSTHPSGEKLARQKDLSIGFKHLSFTAVLLPLMGWTGCFPRGDSLQGLHRSNPEK